MKMDHVTTQPTLTAERFVMRPMRRSDAGLIAHYLADPRVAQNSRNIPHPYPAGAAEAMIDRSLKADRSEDVWVLDGTEHGQSEVLGLLTLTRMERNQSEVSYWVAPAFWKTGLASEALSTLIKANPHQSKTLFAAVFQDHPGTARVLTNCGFDYLGDAEAFCVARKAVLPTWTYMMKLD